MVGFGGRTLILLTLKPTGNTSQPFSGSFARPQHFQTADSVSYSHINGDVETEPITASEWKDGSLSLTVVNPADPSDKDSYLLSVQDNDHALMQLLGVPLPPISLVRSRRPVVVSTDWAPDRTYSPDDDAPSNAEMRAIFEEDQKVRQPSFKIDWPVVGKSDAERRQATFKLLRSGALHTGEDFTWAAFLFQHGSGPNDYLLAHTLAMIAVKKGYGDALWIATATLDRYLQSIKQPQIYGTQFLTPNDLPTTQDPYDRTLISDSLRRQLGVPSLSAQQEQTKQYDVERKK
ncbi:hypothetical protein [Granulicella arctica]|uniref:hypothetical protein n=1 Tax=Granulicella arctica TaxID=940613 RepID=UPI0021E06738|nr:hypothetical protein [Granulicella arctica]